MISLLEAMQEVAANKIISELGRAWYKPGEQFHDQTLAILYMHSTACMHEPVN
jgi:hypothetical protein